MIYVGGAIGVEMLRAWWFSIIEAAVGAQRLPVQRRDVLCNLLVTLKESMELIGVVLFIYALLDYFRRQGGGLYLRLEK